MLNGARGQVLRDRLLSYVRPAERWRRGLLLAVAVVLVARLCLGLIMGAVWFVAKPHLPPEQVCSLELNRGLPVPTEFPADALLGVWQRWDAIHYLNLARVGYFGLSDGESVFYPLYPFFVRWVAPLLGGSYLGAGLLVSTLASVAALTCLFWLAEEHYGPDTARWTVCALAVFPTAFFLLAPYGESLFLALTIGAFIAAHRKRWWLVGLLAGMASLTRGPGVMTPAALAWLAWDQRRRTDPRRPIAHAAQVGLGVGLPIVTCFAFNWWRLAAGYPPITTVLRKYVGLEVVNPVTGIVRAVAQLVSTLHPLAALEVASTFLFVGLTVAMVRVERWRKWPWIVHMILNLTLLLSKVSYLATSFHSNARYVIVLFPGFIVIGDWLSRLRPRLRFAYLACSGALLLVASSMFGLWFFLG
jgi:hypothetical protein